MHIRQYWESGVGQRSDNLALSCTETWSDRKTS